MLTADRRWLSEKIDVIAIAVSKLFECHKPRSHVLYSQQAVVSQLEGGDELESYQFASVVAQHEENQSKHSECKSHIMQDISYVVIYVVVGP